MLPTLIIGSWSISTYALAYLLMFFVIGTWAFVRLRALNLPMQSIGWKLLWVLLGGLLGAYLPVLIPSLVNFSQTGIFIWLGRERVLAGIAAALIVAFLLWEKKTSFSKALDLGIFPFPLGMAIGRLGCFAAGCCYGVATQSWLGVYLRDETGAWYTRYPTQLLSAAANLFIFFILVLLERWNQRNIRQNALPMFDGYIFLAFVVLYSTKRFIIQFLRYDYAPLIGPLDSTQLICLAALMLAAGRYGALLLRSQTILPLKGQEP